MVLYEGPENVIPSSHLKVTTAWRVVLLPSSQPLGRIPGEPQLISGLLSDIYINIDWDNTRGGIYRAFTEDIPFIMTDRVLSY